MNESDIGTLLRVLREAGVELPAPLKEHMNESNKQADFTIWLLPYLRKRFDNPVDQISVLIGAATYIIHLAMDSAMNVPELSDQARLMSCASVAMLLNKECNDAIKFGNNKLMGIINGFANPVITAELKRAHDYAERHNKKEVEIPVASEKEETYAEEKSKTQN